MKTLSTILIISFMLLTLCSCNKELWEFCKQENLPEYETCAQNCELAMPNLENGETKEDAVKSCKKRCKTKLREDQTNCYYSGVIKCTRKCARERSKVCKQEKRNCKKDARARKRNCIGQCKNDFRRGRQRRQCKRNCRRTFRNEKRQCNTINCRKSQFNDECLTECQ